MPCVRSVTWECDLPRRLSRRQKPTALERAAANTADQHARPRPGQDGGVTDSGAESVLVHLADEGKVGQGVVFLDRDGVIIQNRPDYVKSWEEVRFIDGAMEALRRLSEANFTLVVISNQSAVGRGIITLERALEISRRVVAEVQVNGALISASYLCPHRPDHGCDCRKPSPGMMVRAARDLGLDLGNSFLVGDNITDLKAAGAIGARAILVRTGLGTEYASLLSSQGMVGCWVVEDLSAAASFILDHAQHVPPERTEA
mgnify:CR=1 FL=1